MSVPLERIKPATTGGKNECLNEPCTTLIYSQRHTNMPYSFTQGHSFLLPCSDLVNSKACNCIEENLEEKDEEEYHKTKRTVASKI